MHHLYPTTKGDSLCPLGFHPQVRWPTRCKRCFRDYKEHFGNKIKIEDTSLRRDTVTASSPSLSQSLNSKEASRHWASSDNLYDTKIEPELTEYKSNVDLSKIDNVSSFTSLNLKLPRRRITSSSSFDTEEPTEGDQKKDVYTKIGLKNKDSKRIQIKEVQSISNGPTNNDVQFIIQVKKKSDKQTPLENNSLENDKSYSSNFDLRKQLEDTLGKLEVIKTKCEKLEREKHDILLRRLPMSSSSNKTPNETVKLQQKCNELQGELKEYKDEKHNLQMKIKKLEEELKLLPNDQSKNVQDELKSKLRAAETLCEELMDENEGLKKDIHEMEEQMDEMQDNFREDQVAEYTSLKGELEQTTKNCRILSFKLRKAERKSQQLEMEKQEHEKRLKELSENQSNTNSLEKIKQLEKELADSTSVSNKLQDELGELNKKISELETSKSAKTRSNKTVEKKTINKISRQSLIRSSSQEEPDRLPETSEIEKDLREQLKYSEEEAEKLRKMISRVENDNEVLLLQFKKLADQVKNNKLHIPGSTNDMVDDEELKLQLELSETDIIPRVEKVEIDNKLNKVQLTKPSKLSEIDKNNTNIKEYEQQLKDLKTKIDEEKLKNKQKQTEHTKALKKWENESKKLKTQIETLEESNKSLNETIKINGSSIEKLEKKLAAEKVSLKNLYLSEIDQLKKLVASKDSSISEIQSQINTLLHSESELKESIKVAKLEKETTKTQLEKKIKEIEGELKNERKKLELFKKESETRKNELILLKQKMLNKESTIENKQQLKIKELEDGNKKLSTNLTVEKQKLKEITVKYEDLEEEFALTKAKIGVEKESVNNELQTTKQRLEVLQSEVKTVRETYTKEREEWLKEKSKYMEKIKEIGRKTGTTESSTDLDKMRYNSIMAEKQSELEKYRKENEAMNSQLDYMRRETDEMRKKLDDYQKVNKVQRNMNADSSAMDKEIRELTNKLSIAEKSRKSELVQSKMKYEEQINVMNHELKILQSQIVKFKRERDNFKNMLQSAQKSIGDLKHVQKRSRDNSLTRQDNGEESLEHQVNTLEDELSESKLENSKLKTQLVSDKSSYEIKLLELHTKVNELEEEKILSSGRTKIAGLRTRMELSWQKEREEQQRLVQETATLARDLRQTLFEVEKERDKERLEAKRKFEQIKKSGEEEQIEFRKKVKDLQCDLLELRDAHAKLRTTNERLKRDREKYKRDEEIMRHKSLSRGSLSSEEKSSGLISRHLETLQNLAKEIQLLENKPPLKSSGPKSENPSSKPLSFEDKKGKLEFVTNSLLNITEDLKTRLKQAKEIEQEAILRSQQTRGSYETLSDANYFRSGNKLNSNKSSLKRRSLSLEHTISKEQNTTNIWQNNNSSVSSLRSAGSDLDMWNNENASIDSRLSDSSTHSDMMTTEKKKKKGLIGKLKKMTKSRSIDDPDSGGIISNFRLPKTPSSLENVNEGKKELKDRISGIFKRSGSSSRSNSMERQKAPEAKHDTSSRQRPLMRGESPRKNI